MHVEDIKQEYRFTALRSKLEELADYASAGRKGNQAVTYDAMERLVFEASRIVDDIQTATKIGKLKEFAYKR